MDNFTRAIVVRRQILKREDARWQFEVDDGIGRALIFDEGWRALLWARVRLEMRVGSLNDHREAFLDGCRRQQFSHTLDVWVDDLGKVLSTQWDDSKFKVICLTRGQWETRHFGVPPPKNRRSPYYSDLLG